MSSRSIRPQRDPFSRTFLQLYCRDPRRFSGPRDRVSIRRVPRPKAVRTPLLRHRLLEILVDLVEEAGGREPFLLWPDKQRQILGHVSGFDRFDADLLEGLRELGELLIAVEFGAVGEAAGPGEDRGDRVGRGLAAFLV